MSYWIKIKKEDIEIDGDEINVLLDFDEFGNRYAVIKIKDIKELLSK